MYVYCILYIAFMCMFVCMQEDELQDAVLLVFANKQDSRGALNAQQVRRAELRRRDAEASLLSVELKALPLLCH